MHPTDFNRALRESNWLNRLHGDRQLCARCDGLQRTTSRAVPCTRCGGTGYELGPHPDHQQNAAQGGGEK